MRYFVQSEGRTRGPLTVEEIASLPGFGPRCLVCPEGRDPRDRRHWTPARQVAALGKASSASSADSGSRAGAVVGALIVAAAVLRLLMPTDAAESPPPSKSYHSELAQARAAVRSVLPSCLQLADGDLPAAALSFDGKGGYEMTLLPFGRTFQAPARFYVDTARGTYRPLDKEAERLADIRTACAGR